MKKILSIALLSTLTTFAFSQITVNDYTRKVDIDVSKINELPPVVATSTCGDVKIEAVDNMFSGGCLGTLVRTYTYTDDCGNSATAEQYILLQDVEAPVLQNVPVDIVVSGKKIPKPVTVTATDNVGDDEVEVTMTETKVDNTVVREWTAADKCGNVSKAKQTITISGV